MRVLVWHEDTREPGQGGGAESMLRDLTAGLQGRGHEVAWLQSAHMSRAVEQYQPDIVQVMTIHNAGWLDGVRWLQEQQVPHVWAMMDYWPFCGNRNLLRGWQSCSAVKGKCDKQCPDAGNNVWRSTVDKSRVVALNGYTADIFERNGVSCDYIAELGIDTTLFKPGQKRRGSVYASSAWASHPVKGMQVVREAIRGSKLDVNLITGMPREKVAEALHEADIYVFPSLYEETFGLCLCEAMASGCACIASDVAGAHAQIQDGVTGLLFPPGDAKRLRYYIDLLTDNPRLARQLGDAARAHVEQDHTLEAMARRWEAVYQEILANTQERVMVGGCNGR